MSEPTVALQVVAGHDREGRKPALAAAPERLGDQAEGGARHRAWLEVADHIRVAGVEVAGDVTDVVAALGDCQGHDAGRLGGHPRDDRLGIVGREQVLHDGPDHARLVRPVAVFEHERVKAVLSVQGLLHAPVRRHHPDPADAPVQRCAVVHQAIVVHRLVRTVEAAYAEMDNAWLDAVTVVQARAVGHASTQVSAR